MTEKEHWTTRLLDATRVPKFLAQHHPSADNVVVVESYLELRVRQNEAFCRERLEEGRKQKEPKDALMMFQQGLELIPDHPELLKAVEELRTRPPKIVPKSSAALQSVQSEQAAAQAYSLLSSDDDDHRKKKRKKKRKKHHKKKRRRKDDSSIESSSTVDSLELTRKHKKRRSKKEG